MERYSCRTIDDLGRIGLHNELLKKLGLETESSITLKLVDTMLILQRVDGSSNPEDSVC